ncbi:MAG: methyltransferase domain-containing protein [Candidatus Thermoplasmatota archaeon]|nr:methyltransferase domain-containing protein [Candidatus Thermoplasmatota archaeon]
MKIIEINRCRICGNTDLISILNLGDQILSNRFPSAIDSKLPKAPLELVKCNDENNQNACGLLQLKHSVSPDEMYGKKYGYRSGINKTMKQHLEGIIRQIEQLIKLQKGDVVLDIGSNDATLLKCYRSKDIIKIGIDPTGKQFEKFYNRSIKLIPDYFSASSFNSLGVKKKVKAITSIAMFYDLEEPTEFVKDIKKILHPEGIWLLEQSYMPTMLMKNSFDTICHEHLEYYSLKQIEWMLKKNDLRILDVQLNTINGGSFRVCVSHKETQYISNYNNINNFFTIEKEMKLNTKIPFKKFERNISDISSKLFNFINEEKKNGKSIFVYGASTKGNVILQYCGIDNKLITCAADRNPDKWGLFTPGTNIPIVSEKKARDKNPDYFLILPWHFRNEFLEREAKFLESGGKFIFPLPNIEIMG